MHAFSPLPSDYADRVYAGVLGKIIGVYIGRPFEQWLNPRIEAELGEIWYYVHEKVGAPLVVTDDDITGTFTFLRALEDHDYSPDLTPEQIGQTWLNYIIKDRTILWWGGVGHSTEHTAYLRLRKGIKAPESGSMALNGQVVAEQIGAQIFIDGWGLLHPNDPQAAADFARRAGSVSHDGEAIYGAQSVAAMIARAFSPCSIDDLLDTALSVIPESSTIATLIRDIRAWHASGLAWRESLSRIIEQYGYAKYGGGCHMVPNHAVIVLGLLYGEGDFQKSQMVTNTAGYDTDCNAANVGCILGVRNGLAGLDSGPDWRGPVSDRVYLPTADGGRCVSTATAEAVHVLRAAYGIRGDKFDLPKGGAVFHFSFPGSVQGFRTSDEASARGVAELSNDSGQLRIDFKGLTKGRLVRVTAETFPNNEIRKIGGYELLGSPTLYPGQIVTAQLSLDASTSGPVELALCLGHFGGKDDLLFTLGAPVTLYPGSSTELSFPVPDLGGYPTAEIGLQAWSDSRVDGAIKLDWLTWSGAPSVSFQPLPASDLWHQSWVNGVDQWNLWTKRSFMLIQNEGVGLVSTGTRAWTDLRFEANLYSHLTKSCGLAVRHQGMRRYYALLLADNGEIRLVKQLDGETVLGSAQVGWSMYNSYALSLEVSGNRLRGYFEGKLLIDITDEDRPLTSGGIALVVEEGRLEADSVRVSPVA